MNSELNRRPLSVAFALVCMLAAAQAQQPRSPAEQGYLGVELRPLKRAEAQAASLPYSGGAAIAKVEANSPATEAGLKRGDILLEIDGKPVSSAAQALKAASGNSVNGGYYLIPQDYQGGPNPESLKARAIGQERLQDWIGNRVRAKKALILLDTCESGALVGGYTKSRVDTPSSEAAMGRLHEATGRPVLTAAAAGKPAFEGYKGHGVFTYALIEALHKGDTNNNGLVELTELAAHVQKRVPELVAELGEHGGVVKGAAIVAMRGAEGDKQSAHFGSTGEDFSIAARLP